MSDAPAPATPGCVLITGANGHLGRRLIRHLAEGERDGGRSREPRVRVRAVVRSQRAAGVLASLAGTAPPETRVLDYRDADAMARAAEGCDAAVHLVGILKEGSTSRYAEAHEATSEALARAAASTGLRRIVYLSILGAHPDAPNACLASKGRAERILLDAPTPALVLRVPMVIGDGDAVARTLRGQARARFVPLLRGGAGREQPIDARDVVRAIESGLVRDGLDDVALDLAGPECLSRRELLERTAALYGSRPRVIPIPVPVALFLAALAERLLRDPPVTRAMIGVLDHDDETDAVEACHRLGIELTPLTGTLRRCVGPDAEAGAA